jgi:hypothetical protein
VCEQSVNLERFRFLWAGVAFRRVYTIVLCFRKSRCNRQKNASRTSVMDRRRVRRSRCSGPVRAAVIPTRTKLFMAITLSRCNRKTEDNSRDAIHSLVLLRRQGKSCGPSFTSPSAVHLLFVDPASAVERLADERGLHRGVLRDPPDRLSRGGQRQWHRGCSKIQHRSDRGDRAAQRKQALGRRSLYGGAAAC